MNMTIKKKIANTFPIYMRAGASNISVGTSLNYNYMLLAYQHVLGHRIIRININKIYS